MDASVRVRKQSDTAIIAETDLVFIVYKVSYSDNVFGQTFVHFYSPIHNSLILFYPENVVCFLCQVHIFKSFRLH